VKESVSPKLCLSTVIAEKVALFQMTKIPQEAPRDGTKSNLSNLRGINFLRKGISMVCILVSWRQMIEQVFSSILSLTASCFKPTNVPAQDGPISTIH